MEERRKRLGTSSAEPGREKKMSVTWSQPQRLIIRAPFGWNAEKLQTARLTFLVYLVSKQQTTSKRKVASPVSDRSTIPDWIVWFGIV